MATDDLDFYPYYKAQAGSGISSGHVGDRYHIGNGMWGTVLNYLPKALKYISRFGLGGLKSFSENMLDGKTIGDAGVSALTSTAQNVINDANTKLTKFKEMRGRGRPKGSKNKKKTAKKAKKPTKKSNKKTSKPKKKIVKKVYKRKTMSMNYI